MNSSELTLAGYAAITQAAILIPSLLISLFPDLMGLNSIKIFFDIFTLVIFVYITLMQINLYEEFDFYEVNKLLWITIVLSVLATFLNFYEASHLSVRSGIGLGILAVIIACVYGVVMIVIGIKLQNCKHKLHGLLKYFSYSHIGTGICLATIILIPLSFLVMIALSIIQGMIFFREAELRKGIIY